MMIIIIIIIITTIIIMLLGPQVVFTSHKAYFSLADQLEHSHLEV